MHIRYLLIPLNLVFGFIFFGLFGLALAIIFAIIWFDKSVLWFFNSLGIELTTIAMIMIGIIYGPLVGFFFALVVLPVLEGMKTFYLPAASGGWPPFIPQPYHVLDGMVAAIAWFMKDSPLFLIMLVAVFLKCPATGLIDEFVVGKPANILKLIISGIFNMAMVFYLNGVLQAIITL